MVVVVAVVFRARVSGWSCRGELVWGECEWSGKERSSLSVNDAMYQGYTVDAS